MLAPVSGPEWTGGTVTVKTMAPIVRCIRQTTSSGDRCGSALMNAAVKRPNTPCGWLTWPFSSMNPDPTAYTLLRTRGRLDEARERTALRESALRARLALEGVTDPTEIESRLDQDATLTEYRNLVQSRREQREDMIALGIFLLFLSGADAYVSTHLARFPAPIELQVAPTASGRTDVGLSVPLPNLP